MKAPASVTPTGAEPTVQERPQPRGRKLGGGGPKDAYDPPPFDRGKPLTPA